jgi:hypothetical protein
MRRPIVRQNPDPRGSPDSRTGPSQARPEQCHIHGQYLPSRAWLELRRQALSGQETPQRSAALLEAAARIRQTCRECNDRCLTGPEWARRVRLKIETREWEGYT